MRSIDIESRPKLESKLKISIGDPLTACQHLGLCQKNPMFSKKNEDFPGNLMISIFRKSLRNLSQRFTQIIWIVHSKFQIVLSNVDSFPASNMKCILKFPKCTLKFCHFPHLKHEVYTQILTFSPQI